MCDLAGGAGRTGAFRCSAVQCPPTLWPYDVARRGTVLVNVLVVMRQRCITQQLATARMTTDVAVPGDPSPLPDEDSHAASLGW
jgi:hypothetical protein